MSALHRSLIAALLPIWRIVGNQEDPPKSDHQTYLRVLQALLSLHWLAEEILSQRKMRLYSRRHPRQSPRCRELFLRRHLWYFRLIANHCRNVLENHWDNLFNQTKLRQI